MTCPSLSWPEAAVAIAFAFTFLGMVLAVAWVRVQDGRSSDNQDG